MPALECSCRYQHGARGAQLHRAGELAEETAETKELSKCILAHCLLATGKLESRNCLSCDRRVFAKWPCNSEEALQAAAASHAWLFGKTEEDLIAMAAAAPKRKRFPCPACGKQLADLDASLKAHAHSTPCRFARPAEMIKEIEVICLKRFG